MYISNKIILELFGADQYIVKVRSIEEFPKMYKEKMFKPQEMKPLTLVKTELGISPSDDLEDDDEGDVLNELGLNEDDFMENIDEEEEDEEEEEDGEDDGDEDFKVDVKDESSLDDSGKKKSLNKKRAPKTCEKCHKTYNTQTQFRIHQRVSWIVLLFTIQQRQSNFIFRMHGGVLENLSQNGWELSRAKTIIVSIPTAVPMALMVLFSHEETNTGTILGRSTGTETFL